MNTFLQIIWEFDPAILRLGSFEIRYYGVLFATGLALSYYYISNILKKDGFSIKVLDKITAYTVIGAVLGARFGHVIFYDWWYYKDNIIESLYVWQGGLASHGGAIGILIALLIYSRADIQKYLYTLDRIVIPTALTGALIRLGNLFNSEIYGVETDLPWGFVFVKNFETVPKHPTQIYESLAYLLIFVILHFYFKRKFNKTNYGRMLGLFLVMVFGLRFFVEFIKNNQSEFEEGMLLNMGQILSIPLVLIGIFLIIKPIKYSQTKPDLE